MSALQKEHTGNARRQYLIGLALLFLAAVMFSLNGALIKLLDDQGNGPSAVTIAFYRSLIAGVFLLPFARGRLRTLRPSDPTSRLWIRPAGLACIGFFTAMTICFVVATVQTRAANATILQYTSTFWVFGLSSWLLKEKPSARDFPILLLAMSGIVIIFAGNAGTDLLGLSVALGAGLLYALLTLMIRLMRDSDAAAVTVMNNLGSALLILPLVPLLGGFGVDGRSAVLLLIIGIVQFGLPYYFYTRGLKSVPASQAALITMAEPVLVPIWTFMAVGETVPHSTIVGGLIIMVALTIFTLAARKRAPAE